MFLFPIAASTPVTPTVSSTGGAISKVPWHYDGVLAGMVDRGLGLAAISTCLGIPPAMVTDRVVALGLTTPDDKPLRQTKHARVWLVSDLRLLINCWLDNWKVSSASEVLGRSVGSIYAQARRLGLPRRARRDLHSATPEALAQLRQARGISPLPMSHPDLFDKADDRVVNVITRANGEVLRIERKQNRCEIKWTMALDLEVSDRSWSNQHYKAIARDLGISYRAVRTRLSGLGLPPHDRKDLVDFYDPKIGQRRLRESGYRLRKCTFRKAQGVEQIFWASSFGETTSKIAKRSKAYHSIT